MIGTGFHWTYEDAVKVFAVFDDVFDGGAEAFLVEHFGNEFGFGLTDGGDLEVGTTAGFAVTSGCGPMRWPFQFSQSAERGGTSDRPWLGFVGFQ